MDSPGSPLPAAVQMRGIAELRTLAHGLDLPAPGTCPPAELLRLGLIPPLPVSEGELLWGYPLLQRAAALGLDALPCRLLPALPRTERLAVALRLEGRPGRYTWAEKTAIRRYLKDPEGKTDSGAALQLVSPLIEGHPDPQLPRRLDLYAALPPHLQEQLDGGRLDLRTAQRLRAFPVAALRQLTEAALSFSERRELLHGLVELAGRHRLSAQGAVELTGKILASPRPLRELARRRLPTVSGLQDRFEAITARALAGSGVKLSPPPWFEGSRYRVEFSFSSSAALTRRLRTLAGLAQRCDELLELLG